MAKKCLNLKCSEGGTLPQETHMTLNLLSGRLAILADGHILRIVDAPQTIHIEADSKPRYLVALTDVKAETEED